MLADGQTCVAPMLGSCMLELVIGHGLRPVRVVWAPVYIVVVLGLVLLEREGNVKRFASCQCPYAQMGT